MNLKDSKTFNFEGELPSSKSLVNRALLLKAVLADETELKFSWNSEALDVVYLNKALKNYKITNIFNVGQGGTTLRFLSVFLSSQPGKWEIHGDESLFKRPQEDLLNFFKAQGVDFEQTKTSLKIISSGWSNVDSIEVSSFKTTQVLSAVLICSLFLENDFVIQIKGEQESDYFQLTLNFLKQMGYNISFKNSSVEVRSAPALTDKFIDIKADWSSAAFMFVLGALCGRCRVRNLSHNDYQPDSSILEILKASGADVEVEKNSVSFKNLTSHKAQDINFKTHPDLFPVLSVFLAFANGTSKLYGAPSLLHKETNRINEIYNLLALCGYKIEKLSDGVVIHGEGDCVLDHKPFEFDCAKDHRLFMAAYILKQKGYKISILGVESIKKSFPEFLEMVDEA